LQRLAQAVQYLAKRALAGAVAEEAVVVLQLDIEAVDVHRWQSGGAVPSDAGGDQYILSHLALPMPECRDNKEGTRWFHRRRVAIGWRIGSGEWRIGESAIRHSLCLFTPKSLTFGRFSGQFALTWVHQWL